MKSKGSIPRLASTLDVSGKHANSPYPQWMKALEDKYQKLHTKIMQSTSVSSVRQLTATGKAKRSEATLSRLSNGAHTYTHKTSLSLNRAGIRGERSFDASRGGLRVTESDIHGTENVRQGATYCLEVTEASQDKDEEEKEEERHAVEDVCGMYDVLGRPKCVPVVEFLGTRWPTPADGKNNREVTVEDRAALRNDLVKHVTAGFETKTKMNYMVTSLPPLRNVKTCVSRISNKTAKSCPAVIESTADYSPPPTRTRVNSRERPQNTSKRKNMRLFAKMSLEAQHAITETLQEMGGEHSSINAEQSCVAGGHRVASSGSAGIQDAVNGRLCSSHIRDYSNSTRSCASSSGASNFSDPRDRKALMGDCMFPDISGRSNRLPRSVNTRDYMEQLRIPGVGRYSIIRPIRERTFQITFGDFDIRYREIISLNREGSETPPIEVKEKAIAKCHDWLAKHMYR